MSRHSEVSGARFSRAILHFMMRFDYLDGSGLLERDAEFMAHISGVD
jgi:hypothetical protein